MIFRIECWVLCAYCKYGQYIFLLAVDLVRHVTSLEDMSYDNVLPLDVASTFVIVCCFYGEVT